MSALLRLEGLTAGYGRHADILSNIDMTAEDGKITGIIGLNGAGKSTLMKVITGFLRPRRGRVMFDGIEQTHLPAHRAIERGIGYVPQKSSLFSGLTVHDNLTLPLAHLRHRGLFSRAEMRRRIDEALQLHPVLRDRQHAVAGSLSGGQQKLLEFRRVQLQQPRLLLVDEPGIGLAPDVMEQVYEQISTLAETGMTIVIVDHNIRRLMDMSSALYVLNLGRLASVDADAPLQGDLHALVKDWLGIGV